VIDGAFDERHSDVCAALQASRKHRGYDVRVFGITDEGEWIQLSYRSKR